MFIGFSALNRAPIKGCHILTPDDIIEGEYLPSDMMIEADSPQGLIQAIGYIKYNMAQKGYGIAMRGQSRLYSTMYPSLYRVEGKKVNYQEREDKFALKIQAAITETKYKAKNYILKFPNGQRGTLYNDLFKFLDLKENDLPPLLQHYGVETPWLDIVDNIWIALWFSCWKRDKPKKPLSFEEKDIYPRELDREVAKYSIYHLRQANEGIDDRKEKIDKCHREISVCQNKIDYFLSNPNIPEDVKRNKVKQQRDYIHKHNQERIKLEKSPAYCYILLIRTPCMTGKNNTSVGWAQNEEAQLVNLRMIVPSYYLRPHTQHALAIKKCNTTQDPDYFSLIEGIIRVKLSDAISWLGESHTFSIGCIFPSPCLDGGLRKLLSLKAFSDDLEIPTP